MDTFVVELTLQLGEYQKTAITLVAAPNEVLAGLYALYAESHNTDQLTWFADQVQDGLGGFIYMVNDVSHVTELEKGVLTRFMPLTTCVESELEAAGCPLDEI